MKNSKKKSNTKASKEKQVPVRTIPMHLCPVCGQKKWQGYTCPVCRYDASTDYSSYHSLADIPKNTESLDIRQIRFRDEWEKNLRQSIIYSMKEELREGYGAQISTISDENQRLKAKNNELESDLADLKAKNMDLEKSLTELKAQLNDLTQKTGKAEQTKQNNASSQRASSGGPSAKTTGSKTNTARTLKEQVNAGATEITFGSYQLEKNGAAEPLRWIILARNGNQVLVTSKYILDCRPFNSLSLQSQWTKSTLRTYLNNTFLKNAFSSMDEFNKIIVTNIEDHGHYVDDRVFLLSESEVRACFRDQPSRRCQASNYARSLHFYESGGYGYWWLRSSGYHSSQEEFVMFVRNDGDIDTYGSHVSNDKIGVRPAMWLNLDA